MINNITDVRGFQAWGAHVGIKSKRRDLALIYSEVPAKISATFTQNVVCAEPIKVAREYVKGGIAQAIVVNAGNANACTGEDGRQGALAMASTVGEELGIPKEHVFVASTGVIGRKFPTEIVVKGIKENVKKLSSRAVAGSFAANAILTTDTFAKEGHISFKIDGKTVNMAGIAKGSGMIHPNMGTMLAFIVCDAEIDHKLMDETFKEAVNKSFNMITVDGDTSTNDTAVLMCNGMANNKEIKSKNSKDYKVFKEKLEEFCMHLAQQIVSDGEGATKMIEYKVIKAPSEEEARQIIRTVSDSSLVKTAIFGRDPNWGRIIAAAGRSGVKFDPEVLDLMVGNKREMVQVLKAGSPTNQDLSHLKRLMRASGIKIILNMNQGEAEAVGWGTDLTFEYVRFNSQYTT